MKYKFYALLLCFSLGLTAKAQKQDSIAFHLSLSEAVEYAQQHQNSILNARIDEQIAANTVKKTIGIGLPQINGNLNFQDFIKIPTTFLPDFISPSVYDILNEEGVKNANGNTIQRPDDLGGLFPAKFGSKFQSSAGLEVSQLLFDGSYIVGLQASKTFKELSSRNLTRTKIETAVAVTKAYYSVLISNEQLVLLDANMIRLKKSLNDTEILYKNGFVEKIDADRLRVLNNNLETERENVLKLLDLNVDLLKFQMGMPIQTKLMLKDSIKSLQMDPNPIASDTTAYQGRIEYSLLQTQKKLNELDLKRYKSQFLPSLAAFGSTSTNYQSNTFNSLYNQSFPTTVVGLRMSVPLFSGGQKLYQVRNAKLEVLKSENNLQNLKNGINLEIAQAQTIYVNGMRSLDNQKRNMELATEVLRVSRIKYEQGVGSSLEVTTAETSLKESQNNYINALYDLLISKVNMDKALGKINY
ncbi:TolC family protein [Daejeonella oryzae]|uniref:TolC family protein n=1 Tax=Daejeonella oryzae TaxID=1122943 RepID=UPI0004138D0A|nr:TolC family protein [Daejeonella oryzae]